MLSRESSSDLSRRDFLRDGAAASAVVALPSFAAVHAQGSDRLRVGLIGCGGRGTGAAHNCVSSSEGVEINAMADLFPDRLERCKKNLKKRMGDKLKATPENCFTGFDAYQRLLVSGAVDMVILATPPAFRPMMLEAAIRANKHVFMEKPVAVCPAGVHQIIKASAQAAQKGRAIVAGTQRRHAPNYIATINRIHEGAIGDVVSARCFWNQGGLWSKPKTEGMSDVEWQIRNWLYFTWLSGDHICEQHIHNLDVINWVMGGPPKRARAMGGRQVRTDALYGNIYDHFAVEYEYPNGGLLTSMCRQIAGCWNQVGEAVAGSKGHANPGRWIKGQVNWSYKSKKRVNPYVQEHADLIASIRSGKPLNEGKRVAESTLTAIMGRMSAYTGKAVTWDFAMNKSELDLRPTQLGFSDKAVDPVAMPGRTPLI